MVGIFVNWLIATVAILLAAYLIPGIRVDSFRSALIGAAIVGVLNALIKPILVILTLPITILTLGIFLFVINALLFQLAGSLFPGFEVRSFGSALLGSLMVSAVYFIARAIGL